MGECHWPRQRPIILDFDADPDVAALASLVDAGRCAGALHAAVLHSHAFDDDPKQGAGVRAAGVSGPWPWCLPAALTTQDDFLELAATCRALRDWCDDVDAEMQGRASHEIDDGLRERLEVAGWHMTELAAAAMHLAALCVAGSCGMWMRDAAERAMRGAVADVRTAMFEYQRHARF